ncbi:protein PRRC1 [Pimephales promelas]|nr:protein PRRC1 [Pimephales promelas]
MHAGLLFCHHTDRAGQSSYITDRVKMMEESGIESTPPGTPPPLPTAATGPPPLSSGVSGPPTISSPSSISAFSPGVGSSPVPSSNSAFAPGGFTSPVPSSNSAFAPGGFTSPVPSSSSAFPLGGFSSPVPSSLPPPPLSLGPVSSPLGLSGPYSSPSAPFTPPSAAPAAHLGPVLSAPPMGPPTTGFSVSAGYDITRGHAGRTPQTPLMPSFSSAAPMPASENDSFLKVGNYDDEEDKTPPPQKMINACFTTAGLAPPTDSRITHIAK